MGATMKSEIPTTAELKAAYDRARAMRFDGWSFERAMATDPIRLALALSAIAHRRQHQSAPQPRLI